MTVSPVLRALGWKSAAPSAPLLALVIVLLTACRFSDPTPPSPRGPVVTPTAPASPTVTASAAPVATAARPTLPPVTASPSFLPTAGPPTSPSPTATSPLASEIVVPFARLTVEGTPRMELVSVLLEAGDSERGLTVRETFDLANVHIEERAHAGPFVTGPHNDEFLLGLDNGERSSLYRVSLTDGSVEQVYVAPEVLMHAAYDVAFDRVYFVRLNRQTMAEEGIWSVDLGTASDPVLLRPAWPDPSGQGFPPYERIWLTPDGAHLLVQRRAASMDWYQVISTADGVVRDVPDSYRTAFPGGLTNEFAVGATFDPRCPHLVIVIAEAASRCVDGPIGQAAITEAGGTPLIVAMESFGPETILTTLDPTTGAASEIWRGDPQLRMIDVVDEEWIALPDGVALLTTGAEIDPLIQQIALDVVVVDVRTGESRYLWDP